MSKKVYKGVNVTPAKRIAIYERDNYSCIFCENTEDSHKCQSILSLDHIIPHSQGGTNDPNNLLTVCAFHNSQRRDEPIEDYVKVKIEDRRKAKSIASRIKRQLKKQIDILAAKETIEFAGGYSNALVLKSY